MMGVVGGEGWRDGAATQYRASRVMPNSTPSSREAFAAALRRYRSVLSAHPIDTTALFMAAHDCGRRARTAGVALGVLVDSLADFGAADLPWRSRLPVDTIRAAAMAYYADEAGRVAPDTSTLGGAAPDDEVRPS